MSEPVYPFGTQCRYASLCSHDKCQCADVVGHFCPISCLTCGGDDDV